jgi:hypothetical protein
MHLELRKEIGFKKPESYLFIDILSMKLKIEERKKK